jgi:hypothetical protein
MCRKLKLVFSSGSHVLVPAAVALRSLCHGYPARSRITQRFRRKHVASGELIRRGKVRRARAIRVSSPRRR